MTTLENNENGAKIRYYQRALVCSGQGLIAFGILSLVKTLMTITLDSGSFWEVLGTEYYRYRESITAVIIVTLVISLMVDLIARTYIGRCAIAEGKGKIPGRKYLYLSCIYVFFICASDIMSIADQITNKTRHILDLIGDLMIDATSAFALIVIVYSAKRLRDHQLAS